MRVMLDTNILISALLFPSTHVDALFEELVLNHTIVLSSYVIDELYDVMKRKFPHKMQAIDRFMSSIRYEFVDTPRQMYIQGIEVRDYKDYPVIYTAILAKVDVLLSGDKDLTVLAVQKIPILTQTRFLEEYSKGSPL
jgi:putative PIN family toxin of toxin-antitoxin system